MGLELRRPARVFSVSELSARIEQTLRGDLSAVWVSGEISGCRRAGPGHIWFCLKDDRCQLDAVMFWSQARTLPFAPADGMDVIVFGRVDLYPQRGKLQIYVQHMEPMGHGAMRLAFEQLKTRLQTEGLFDEKRKRRLPALPRAIGIVTALQGAAIHDMLRTLRERWPGVRIVVRPVRVQGPGAAVDIAIGLNDVQRVPEVDVVIVGRGGGSLEDLWAFNEEVLARAIVVARVPVVSAVGHEVDFTIADFVADVRAPTPTAAAALVVPDRRALATHLAHGVQRLRGGLARRLHVASARLDGARRGLGDPRRRVVDVRRRLDELAGRARHALARRAAWDRRELDGLVARLARHEPHAVIGTERVHVARHAERLGRAIERRLHGARAAVEREAARLAALSPLACLERGYAIVRRDGDAGAVVRDAGSLAAGDAVTLVLARGRARAHIDSTER